MAASSQLQHPESFTYHLLLLLLQKLLLPYTTTYRLTRGLKIQHDQHRIRPPRALRGRGPPVQAKRQMMS